MTKFIISRYNHDIDWIKDYTDDFVLFDRSETPAPNSIPTQNIGSDIYDKLNYIVQNYENLPEVAVYTKANLFKYITKEEFDEIKDNKTFTPILTKNHESKMINLEEERKKIVETVEKTVKKISIPPEYVDLWYYFNQVSPDKEAVTEKEFCFHKDGLFYELNIPYFMTLIPTRIIEDMNTIKEIQTMMGYFGQEYVGFAPGSNYIIPKENILKHSRNFYASLMLYLANALHQDNYPREAWLVERGLYSIWK